jgi:hypothetical protein
MWFRHLLSAFYLFCIQRMHLFAVLLQLPFLWDQFWLATSSSAPNRIKLFSNGANTFRKFGFFCLSAREEYVDKAPEIP